ncbi:MAG: M15 family metallopeptidase [bacterium]
MTVLRPLHEAEVISEFGDPKVQFTPNGPKVDPKWYATSIMMVEIPQLAGVQIGSSNGINRGRALFHKRITTNARSAFADVERAGFRDLILTWDGSYNPRHTRGTETMSRHSWGIAFDINAIWNGFGRTPAAEGTPGSVHEIVSIFEGYGFAWGGNFTKRKDGMHFEFADLSKVTQGNAPLPKELLVFGTANRPDVILSKGDDGRLYAAAGQLADLLTVPMSAGERSTLVPIRPFLESHGFKVKYQAKPGGGGTVTVTKEP